MTHDPFDVLVIGAGMAGLTVARRTAKAGRRVAIVDTRPYGGTCALRGCDPKKVLIGAAEVIDRARRLEGHGLHGAPTLAWGDLMRFKRSFTDAVPEQLERSLGRAGIATLRGAARFTAPHHLAVDGDAIEAHRIVVAVGSRPRSLTFPGAEHVRTSTDFLELEQLPERIAFIGGGYVSFEFAHLAARAGARATIFHRHARVLAGFDPELVDELVRASTAAGIDVRTEEEVRSIVATSAGLEVRTRPGVAVTVDLVVHGAGRVPELEDLDLDAGGVAVDPERGVLVDAHLRSISNPAVYAAGDAAATEGWPLTPVAVHEAFVVAANLLDGGTTTPNYAGTPSVVFTLPELGRVGLLADEARAQGLDVVVRRQRSAGWYSARRTRQVFAGHAIVEDRATGRILGAHVLGDRAADVIDVFALAVRHGLTAQDLKTSILVHPSDVSDVAYMV
ncbi:MAG: NAD(P)/FAD-dependent oxidoreductase [Trueperaceae bacterium]|nr:NAD(P)/FAD-dependent oxidoreductase [Trueperaceae bacterium]